MILSRAFLVFLPKIMLQQFRDSKKRAKGGEEVGDSEEEHDDHHKGLLIIGTCVQCNLAHRKQGGGGLRPIQELPTSNAGTILVIAVFCCWMYCCVQPAKGLSRKFTTNKQIECHQSAIFHGILHNKVSRC